MKILQNPKFYLTAIFLVGLASGIFIGYSAVIYRLKQPLNAERFAAGIQAELTGKLGLDKEQQATVRPLVDRSIKRVEGIYFQTMWKVEEVLKDAQKELESQLRPDQLAKMKDLAESREDFIRKHNPLTPPVETGR